VAPGSQGSVPGVTVQPDGYLTENCIVGDMKVSVSSGTGAWLAMIGSAVAGAPGDGE
jgi:hypothetical protein